MTTILSLIGIIASFFMIKKREMVADMIGEGEWMRKIGGVHLVVVYCGIFLFFWSVAALTGTLDIFFSPLKSLLSPFMGKPEATPMY